MPKEYIRGGNSNFSFNQRWFGFSHVSTSYMCLHSFLGAYLWDTQRGFNELYKTNLRGELRILKIKGYLKVT